MDHGYAKELLEKYRSGQCTDAEKVKVENWIAFGEFPEFKISEQDLNEQLVLMDNSLPLHKERHLWTRIGIAAAIATVIFGAGLFYYTNDNRGNEQTIASVQDIKPGKIGATLTLANGRKILLSDAKSGELAKEAGVIISKTADGQISYEIIGQDNQEAAKINTLSTANGETYVVVLPDRSKVWLNAASSLKYPSSFAAASQRRVELAGEAYFEIAKDRAHPFIVNTAAQEVEVLGTHFNINGYADEATTTTTLLEGSVRVSRGIDKRILKPGQQSLLTAVNFRIENVDAEDAVAWKDGLFIFNDEPLESIMKRIERWYDVKVDYDASVDRKKRYGGSVSRYENVSSVIEVLESTKNLHFKIEGRRIVVMK